MAEPQENADAEEISVLFKQASGSALGANQKYQKCQNQLNGKVFQYPIEKY